VINLFKKKKILILLLILSFFSILLSACSNEQEIPSAKKSRFLMDTLVQMQAHGKNAEKAVEESMDRIKELENFMSKTLETSEIYKINNNPGERIEISDDTKLVLEKSLYYAEITDGKFDPTIGVLVGLWGIGTEDANVPSDSEIENALKNIGYQKLYIYNNQAEVEKGVQLDLGGIAKGYAADEVKKIAEKHNVNSAFVNLGGNVLVIGNKVDGSKWRVGIQDPRQGRGSVMAIIEASDKTIVTSGNYERYFEEDGKVYHHILDPDTGYPADTNLLSVSIISENSFDADALSTSIYILGLEKGMEFIENMEETEVMFITNELEVYLSSGLRDKIEITDEKFNLIEGENFAN
jgi:thiamine biosynthesis lipoprotein